MSKENRKKMYDYLVANDKLSQDDGALVKEFGQPENTDLSYSDMTKRELQIQLDKEEIDYTSKMTKDDMVVLLENKRDSLVEETPEETPEEETEEEGV